MIGAKTFFHRQARAARASSTPLVAIETADQEALIASLQGLFNGKSKVPYWQWDFVRGLCGGNDMGNAALEDAGVTDDNRIARTSNPSDCLMFLASNRDDGTPVVPERCVIFFRNGHRYMDIAVAGGSTSTVIIQAIQNLRDILKNIPAMLIMTGVAFTIPAELSNDILLLDEPLPDEQDLTRVAEGVWEAFSRQVEGARPPESMKAVAGALTGLSAFAAEQAVSMALDIPAKTIDVAALWQRKCKMVSQTRGLTMTLDGPTFDDIGGLDQIKSILRQLQSGPEPFRVVAWVDEIEKVMGGAKSDTSGVAQDASAQFLTQMQENEWVGFIGCGFPGSGKSLLAKSTAKEFGIPLVTVDLNATRDSLVGNSEKYIRAMMKVLRAVGGKDVFFIATCNNLDVLSPELRRRFTEGIYFFDMPTDAEKAPIWDMYKKKYGLTNQPNPPDYGWVGANIQTCCRSAYRRGISLAEAAQGIIPVITSDPNYVRSLRAAADGKWLSVNHPGAYQIPKEPEKKGRRF